MRYFHGSCIQLSREKHRIVVQKLHFLLELITNAKNREKMKLEKRRDKEETRKKLRIVGGERRLGSLSFSPLLVSFRFVSPTGARRGARRAAFECLHYRWLKGGDARSKKEES